MRRLLATGMTAVAISGAALAGVMPASAAAPAAPERGAATAAVTCFGGAVNFTLTPPAIQAPFGAGSFFSASNRCADINIRTSRNTNAKVCFRLADGGSQCNTPKFVPAGTWTVIATNVRDTAKFRVEFSNFGGVAFSGSVAA